MTSSTHNEIRKYFKQIVGPTELGFKLKEAIPDLISATRFAENRIKKMWSGHCLVTGDEILTLQEAARRAEELRRAEAENKLLAKQARGETRARDSAIDESTYALLQVAAQRLAEVGDLEVARRIQGSIRALRDEGAGDDRVVPVLGREARPVSGSIR